MTDEERAEEYAGNILCKNFDNDGTSLYTEGEIKKAVLYGLAEGRKEKWHDLLKNPNDLPLEKDVIIKCSNTYGDNHKVITNEGSLRYFIGGRYYWEPDEDEAYPAGYYWYNSCTDECLDDTGYTVVGWKEF